MYRPPPVTTADAGYAEEFPGIDPGIAIEVLITEAETLRIEGDLLHAANTPCGQSLPLRDLSPLGR